MALQFDERVTDEIEALEAILMDDVTVKRLDGIPYGIETTIVPSTGDDADQQYVCVTLIVNFTKGYPDKCPDVLLRNPRGLDDNIMDSINRQVNEKLNECIGQPVVFELIELVRENLTASNLPSGQCAICLYGFVDGDIFIKTQCYHHFHSHCLANHLIASERHYKEEFDKLPTWQRMVATPFQQTCPVCRAAVSCDVNTLKMAPPPIESVNAAPFCLTTELKALQLKMAELLAVQVAKGGVVGSGECGPAPLTITTASDFEEAENTRHEPAIVQIPNKPPITNAVNSTSSNEKTSPPSPNRSGNRGTYRGFNRRGKPGRRSR